jgi:anaerobic selenocysteine-containing dehydrogenase
MVRRAQLLADPNVDVVTGACPHDCPDACTWQVAVDRRSQRALDIWGHPDHPITRGTLCAKVDRYPERTHHAARLLTPMRRVGPKGPGARFEPISWDAALAACAAGIGAAIADHGPETVLPYSYAGTLGLLQGEGMASRFFHALGASLLARTICAEAGFQGHLYTLGDTWGLATEDFEHARLILIWGSNTLTANAHLWPFVLRARKAGARLVVIDPARTRTAAAADEWIGIRPGTDAALALAMMGEIVAAGAQDEAYLQESCVGWPALRERLAGWSAEVAAPITGIDAGTIRALAHRYASVRPAAIRINYGLQRHRGGGAAVRTITCLPAIVGAWRERGGGILLSSSGAFRSDDAGLKRPDLLGDRRPRTINMNRLGDALALDPARRAQALHRPRPVDPRPTPAEAGPPIHALVVYNANPAASTPDQSAVLAGLARPDLFTVVLEQFATDTVDYADVVLPATTQLEHWDVLKSYGHTWLTLNRPALAAQGESRANSQIFRDLAHALGLPGEPFAADDETLLQQWLAAQRGRPHYVGVTWERLLAEGFVRLALPPAWPPFARGRQFPTPSGACELWSEQAAADGYDPLPGYTAPGWLAAAPGALCSVSPAAHGFLNSSFGNLDKLRAREGEPALWIHPEDAEPRGIADGAEVEVRRSGGTDAATFVARAKVTRDVVRGAVVSPSVWWPKLSPDGRNVNRVTPADEADMGSGARFYDAPVEVVARFSDASVEVVPRPEPRG